MKFAYEQEDGTVAIVIPASKQALERQMGAMTDDAYKAFVISRLIPETVSGFIELDDNWQSPDRSKRSQWRIRNGEIVVE